MLPLSKVASTVTTPRVYSALLSTMANTIGEKTFILPYDLPVIEIRHAIAPGYV